MIYIKDVLDTWVNQEEDKVYKQISPSSLGSCARSHYYKIKGVKATTPPSTSAKLNFRMGFVWEDVIKKALDDLKLPYLFQEYFEDKELNAGGTIDFMLPDRQDEFKGSWKDIEVVIHDSKTMGSKWFWYLEKSNKDFGAENESYLYQLGLYIILARREGYNVNRGLLTFISKDDSMVGKEYEFVLTPEWEEKILTRVKRLNANLKQDKLPPCECEGWKIGYCSYGNPLTRKKNAKGKEVNTECCSPSLVNKLKEQE